MRRILSGGVARPARGIYFVGDQKEQFAWGGDQHWTKIIQAVQGSAVSAARFLMKAGSMLESGDAGPTGKSAGATAAERSDSPAPEPCG